MTLPYFLRRKLELLFRGTRKNRLLSDWVPNQSEAALSSTLVVMIIAERNSIAPTTCKNVATKTSYGFVEEATTRNSTKKNIDGSYRLKYYERGVRNFQGWLASQDAPHRDEASVEDVNRLLYGAESDDQAIAETLVERDWRGFGPYSLRLKPHLGFGPGDGTSVNKEIFTCCDISHEIEKTTDRFTVGYTAQNAQTPDLLGSQEARDWEQQFIMQEVAGLRKGTLYTIAALGNQLLHRAGAATGLLQRDHKGRAYLRGGNAAKKFVLAEHRIWNPIGSTVNAAKHFWNEVAISGSRNSIKRTADWLRDKGFVDFAGDFNEGVWGKGREYFGIDIVRLLLLLECVEKLLGGYKALPRHRMSFVEKLFNAVFSGRRYCRADASDVDLSWRDKGMPFGMDEKAVEMYEYIERVQAGYGLHSDKTQSAWRSLIDYEDEKYLKGLKNKYAEL